MGIYLDYQASTPLDPRVFRAMRQIFEAGCGNPHSTEHAWGWRADGEIKASEATIQECLGAPQHKVIFTAGATEANNLALKGLAGPLARAGKPCLAVTAIEHKCVLAVVEQLEARTGTEHCRVPVNLSGAVDLAALANLLADRDIGLVSVIAVNNEIGTIQELAQIADIVHGAGALLHSDCAQAPCALDAQQLGGHCDLITISGHKIYGPQGIGALLVRSDLVEAIEPLLHGGGQQEGMRSGTVPVALCVGLAEAIRILNEEGPVERERLYSLRGQFWERLQSSLPEIVLNGPHFDSRHPGNLNIQIPGVDAADLIMRLQPEIAISSGSACTSGEIEPSYVLAAANLTRQQAAASLRISVGRRTSRAEINRATEILHDAATRLMRQNPPASLQVKPKSPPVA